MDQDLVHECVCVCVSRLTPRLCARPQPATLRDLQQMVGTLVAARDDEDSTALRAVNDLRMEVAVSMEGVAQRAVDAVAALAADLVSRQVRARPRCAVAATLLVPRVL